MKLVAFKKVFSSSRVPLSAAEPAICSLLLYWQRVRPANALPRRADFLPENLTPFLGWLSIVEVGEGAGFTVRLFGSRLVEWCGQDPTGHPIESLQPPAFGERLKADLREALEAGSPCLQLCTSDLAARWTYQRLTLPLSEGGAQPDRLLGFWDLKQAEARRQQRRSGAPA